MLVHIPSYKAYKETFVVFDLYLADEHIENILDDMLDCLSSKVSQ